MSNTSLGLAFSQSSVMQHKGPRSLSKKGFMSLVPRARHKWAWWRRQRIHCQKHYSQGKGSTMEIKWQCRIKELNHPWGSGIPGFPVTPARGTGDDLERAPVEVSSPVPMHWQKPRRNRLRLFKNHGPRNFVPSRMLTFWTALPVWNLDWKTTVGLLWVQLLLLFFSTHKHNSCCNRVVHLQVVAIRKKML